MDSSADPEKQQALIQEERTAFLSGAPKSGELTPFAAKVAAETFVCLCSMVVFGSTANFGAFETCTPLCRFGIATGVISFIISFVILIGQFLAFTNHAGKGSFLSSSAEKRGMIFLSIWWIIGVSCLSAVEPDPNRKNSPIHHTSGIGIMFGWLALFASIFAAYKAYHAIKEEERSLHYAQVMSMRAAEDEEYANFS